MRISEVMSTDVCVVAPDTTLREAAGLMASHDVGSLPVGEGDRLVGFLTDRDIVLRAVASGHGPEATGRQAMSPDVKYCFEDDDIDDVARKMTDLNMRRLVVYDANRELSGIVSLHDIVAEQQRHSP